MESIWKVYELYDIYGNVIYVGETKRTLERRLYEHTKCIPNSTGQGKFYGQNLSIYAVEYFINRKDARKLESQLKLYYGFELSEKNWLTTANIKNQERVICQYCNKETNRLNYGRWHGDNCKKKGDQ